LCDRIHRRLHRHGDGPPLEPSTSTLGESSLEGFSLPDVPSTATAYRCFTSVADRDGPFAYRYGRMELPAPPGLRQPEDDLIRLTYRLWTEEGDLVRLANCWVPRSRAAVEWAEAWFRAAEGDRNIRWSEPFSDVGSGAGQGDEMGIAGSADGDCVEENSFENPCPIDAVIVVPGDDSGGGDPWDPGGDDSGGDDPCYNCYGDEDPGGGGWTPGDSDCDPDAIDGPDACEQECPHPDWGGCKTLSEERAEIDQIVHTWWRDSDDSHLCRTAKQAWQDFINRGYPLMTFNSGGYGGTAAYWPSGPAIGYSDKNYGFHDGVWNRREIAAASLHEVMHYHQDSIGIDPRTEKSQNEATWVERNCVDGEIG
jgi:hypothetical protein